MKMRKLTYIAAIALAFGALAGIPSAAQALTIGDQYDLGGLTPPEPAGPAQEEHYVNTLLSFSAGPHTILDNDGVLRTYTRTLASCRL
jgi:hypothetical protein